MKDKKPFDLESPYTLNQAAEFLGKSASWVRENAIKTGELQYAPLGDTPVVTGKWILEFVKLRGTFQGDVNCPPNNRGGKRSRRKKTDGADATS